MAAKRNRFGRRRESYFTLVTPEPTRPDRPPSERTLSSGERPLTARFGDSSTAITWSDDHTVSWAELTRYLCVDSWVKVRLQCAALLHSAVIDPVTFDLVWQPGHLPDKMGLRANAFMDFPVYADLPSGYDLLPNPFVFALSVAWFIEEPMGLDDTYPIPDANGVHWRREGLEVSDK